MTDAQATISSFYVGFTDWNSRPDPCLGKNFYLLSHLSKLTQRRKVWSSHLADLLMALSVLQEAS